MFTTEFMITSEFDEKLVKKDDELDYKCVTTKADTKFSRNSMPYRSEETESWTFVEVENNQDNADNFAENLRHNECLKDTETLVCTGNNAKKGKMDKNCTVLRAESLKFFEDSKFKRDYEWTSSYFAKENNDDLLQRDNDLNGNYGYLAFANETKASSSIVHGNLSTPLSKVKQKGKHDGNPVLEPQGGHESSDNFSKKYQIISADNSVTSAYKDIRQVGHDMREYVRSRDGYIVPSLDRECFQKPSHDGQSSRKYQQEFEVPKNSFQDNETSSDGEKRFEKQLQDVDGDYLWDNDNVSYKLTAKLTNTSSGSTKDVQEVVESRHTTEVPSQAENYVQEEKIVPVSLQRQSVCCDLFEGLATLEEETPDNIMWSDGDQHDEIVVIAVCDDDNDGRVDAAATAAAVNDDEDNCVTINVNHDNDNHDNDNHDNDVVISNHIRLTKWYAYEDCPGDDRKLPVSYHGNYGDVIRDIANDADENDANENDADDGCHGDISGDYCNDEMITNDGNPFELEESEYQKLMQAMDDSFEFLLDNHPDEPSLLEHDTESKYVSSDWMNLDTGNAFEPSGGMNIDTGNPFEPCDGTNIDTGNAFEPCDGTSIDKGNPFEPCDGTNIDKGNPVEPCDGTNIDKGNPFEPCDGTNIDKGNPFEPCDGTNIEKGNPFEPCDELNLDLTDKSTEHSSYENKHHDEVGLIEQQEQMRNTLDESECSALVCEESIWGSEDMQDDGSKCDENKLKEYQEQIENQTNDNELTSDSHQVQTVVSSTNHDRNSVVLQDDEINFVSSLESRTEARISELDKYGEDYKNNIVSVVESLPLLADDTEENDKTRILEKRESQDFLQEQNALYTFDIMLDEANNSLRDDGVKHTIEKRNEPKGCQDELEDVIECGNAVLAETSSNSIDKHVQEDVMKGDDGGDKKQQESNLPHAEPSTKTSDFHAKEDEKKEIHSVTESDQDQQKSSQFTIPVIVEPSTTLREDPGQCTMDGNTFLSLLEAHGILTPQTAQDEQPSERELSNEDPANLTKDLSVQERIQNINKAFDWIRKELQEMRGIDFDLKVQFDGLRQEARTLREEYESFVNCEYYDDDEIFDEATEYNTCQKDSSNASSTNHVKDTDRDKGNPSLESTPLLHNALREDSGYHSDTPSSSTDAGSTDNAPHSTHAHARYYYQPQPTHPKIQELQTSGQCVFELQL